MCGEVGVGKYALLEKLASVEDATELGQGRYLEVPVLHCQQGTGGGGTRGQGPAIEPGREGCERSGAGLPWWEMEAWKKIWQRSFGGPNGEKLRQAMLELVVSFIAISSLNLKRHLLQCW